MPIKTEFRCPECGDLAAEHWDEEPWPKEIPCRGCGATLTPGAAPWWAKKEA